MNILITGGSGFIGTNMVELLLEKPEVEKIVNVDKRTYASNTFYDNFKLESLIHYKEDICNTEKMLEILEKEQIDSVIHMAAESHVDNSINGSKVFLETNVLGTGSLLDAVKKYYGLELSKHRFIHVSTDEVFGALKKDEKRFSLTSPYNPKNPYSASKAGADHLVASYGNTHGLNYTITNCSNNFGPYQHPEKFIPTIIYKFLKGQSVPVYGNGQNVRDWIYVKDHCALIWDTLQYKYGDRELFGGYNEISNIDMILLMADYMEEMGLNIKRDIQYVIDRKGHDFRYAISPTRSLNYYSGFATNLKNTISWYKDNLKWVESKLAEKR